jgi:hypothetical protein
MNSEQFSEWMAGFSTQEKLKALALIYSKLTVNSRELFIRERIAGKENRVLEILHGLNEIHHTLSQYLVGYATDESKVFPAGVLSQQLKEVEDRYHLEGYLTPAIDSVRTHIQKR